MESGDNLLKNYGNDLPTAKKCNSEISIILALTINYTNGLSLT